MSKEAEKAIGKMPSHYQKRIEALTPALEGNPYPAKLVFPSMYEGFDLPILEAQARGLPVIIYKKGGISKEIRKYCLGARGEKHMAGIIGDLRRNGYDIRIKKKTMEYVRSFTWAKCAQKTSKSYMELTGFKAHISIDRGISILLNGE